MIISRLPNIRASSEKAPGPSRIIDKEITIIKPRVKIPGLFAEKGKTIRKILARQTILLNKGVKNPAKSKAPMILANNPKTQNQFCEFSLANK